MTMSKQSLFSGRLTAFLSLAFAALLGAQSVAAAEPYNWYAGGGIGVAEVHDLCKGVPREFCDDNGFALQGLAGWRPSRMFALEAAFNFAGQFTTPSARAIGYDGDTSASFLSVNAIGFIPLGSRVSLLGGITGAFTFTTTEVSDDRYTTRDCDWEYDWFDDDWEYRCRNYREENKDYESDVNIAAGALVGVEVQVARRFSVRGQAQRFFNVDGGLSFGERRHVDVVTANVLFAF
jgi:hypothetical protein